MRTLATIALLALALGLVALVHHVGEPRAGRSPLTYEALCGANAEADVQRRARLAAIVHELDAAVAAHEHVMDRERARRVEFARRLDPLRAPVDAVFEDVVAHAVETVGGDTPSAPVGAIERLRAVRLRWIDPRDPGPVDERALHRGCGSDLLVDDAWVDKSASEVVLCPGLLLVAGAHGRNVRAGLSFLIAHELGHVIAGTHSSDERAERAAEVEADRWAARILASVVESVPDAGARARFVRASVEPICAPKGDATHPAGPDRVRVVAREASRLTC